MTAPAPDGDVPVPGAPAGDVAMPTFTDPAEERLWRLRNGLPGPAETAARKLAGRHPGLAAAVGLTRALEDAAEKRRPAKGKELARG